MRLEGINLFTGRGEGYFEMLFITSRQHITTNSSYTNPFNTLVKSDISSTTMNTKLASYATYVAEIKPAAPCLTNLHQWLSTADSSQMECRISALDFIRGGATPLIRRLEANDMGSEIARMKRMSGPPALHETSPDKTSVASECLQGCLFVIEDPTREVVGTLGVDLEISPVFFASYIDAPEVGYDSNQPRHSLLPSDKRPLEYATFGHSRTFEYQDPERHPETILTMIRRGNVKRKIALLPSNNSKTQPLCLLQHCTSTLLKFLDNGAWIGT
jgi:hypothetical protein